MNRETFTLLFALISVIVAVATPEIRCYLGLQRDSCPWVKIPLPVVNPPAPPSTSVSVPMPVVPAPPSTPVSIPVLVSPPPPKSVPLPVPPPESGNISDIFSPKPDKFEKTSEFQARREQLLAKFNQDSQQGDSRYQAGVASLKDYNADAENLFVTLEWQATWVKLFVLPKSGMIKIAPSAAKTFWQEGPQKLLYVQMERVGEQLKIKSGVLTGNGQVWYISLPPLPEMITIPAGSFRMGDIQGTGDSDEQPVHTVTVKSFAMSRHEVTFEEYDYFAEQTGREKPTDEDWGRGNRPVINVSWDDATAYVEWLSGLTGEQYRLPTEAEWEYAARAGMETDYWWGNTASHEYANYGKDECCGGLVQGKDQWEFTAPVCSFVDNPFGLCDTVGNVWEWTCSEYEEKYTGKELECISKNRADDGSLRVIRGGAWNSDPLGVRASTRTGTARATRNYDVGFRLARM